MNWNSSILWGIIGILVTIFFYKLDQRTKKLIYTKNSQSLITDTISKIDGLNITYFKKPIKNLTSTTIKIKSTGKDIIEMSDFAQLSPLSLKTDGKFVSQSVEISNSNPLNPIEFNCINDSTIQLKYDYFKRNDLITITLFHTGNLTVTGELKKGKIVSSDSINKKKNIFNIIDLIGISLGIIFIFLISLPENGDKLLAYPIVNLIYSMILGMLLINYFTNRHYFSKNNNDDK